MDRDNMKEKVDEIIKKTIDNQHKKQNGFKANTSNMLMYSIYDILLPAFKNTISDLIKNGVDMLLFGEVNPRRGSSNRRRKRTSYSSYSRRDGRRYHGSERRERQKILDYRDVIFDDFDDADDVLNDLCDLIEEYDQASVADFYELINSRTSIDGTQFDVTGSFTDNRYGWRALGTTKVRACDGGGYYIDLPKPKVIER